MDCPRIFSFSQGSSIPKNQFVIKKQNRKCMCVLKLGRIRVNTVAVEKL